MSERTLDRAQFLNIIAKLPKQPDRADDKAKAIRLLESFVKAGAVTNDMITVRTRFMEKRQAAGPSEPAAIVVPVETKPTTTKRKEPSGKAMKAYRVWAGMGGTQDEIAKVMTRELGLPISQGQVSRWLTEVRRWLEAGNVLPPLGSAEPVIAMDPQKLDRGRRVDGRTPRQRAHADKDD
jgi:hypothetical protein